MLRGMADTIERAYRHDIEAFRVVAVVVGSGCAFLRSLLDQKLAALEEDAPMRMDSGEPLDSTCRVGSST